MLFQQTIAILGVGGAENLEFVPESSGKTFERLGLVIDVKDGVLIIIVSLYHCLSPAPTELMGHCGNARCSNSLRTSKTIKTRLIQQDTNPVAERGSPRARDSLSYTGAALDE